LPFTLEGAFVRKNDFKHNSISRCIPWLKTPLESLDANPIEDLWHEFKGYIRREMKPTNRELLVRG